ncbi:RCC1 domain-containing protein [Georgenia sp. Marseille-Q6866]
MRAIIGKTLVLLGLLAAMTAAGGPPVAADGAPAPPSISAGGLHTCAVTAAGAATCWGFNEDGQVGDGTNRDRHEPGDVVGRATGTAAVATGDRHTCALTDDGGVQCWGSNETGELGTGVTGYGTGSPVPVDVVGLGAGVAAVSSGHGFTCVVTVDGGAQCWGSNSRGQLGDGADVEILANPSSPVPGDVIGLDRRVADISTGQAHTCALTDVGAVLCWGANSDGQLGDGGTDTTSVPVHVVGLDRGIAAVSAGGQHTCALTEDGAVLCWGRNGEGQLGTGSRTSSSVPVPVSGLDGGVTAISAGQYHTCALTDAGDVTCWGSNTFGELGNGYEDQDPSETPEDHVLTPVPVLGLDGEVAAVSAGGGHTVALTTSGEAWAWGDNYYGQLGDRALQNRNVPSRVHALDLDGPLVATPGRGGQCLTSGATVALTVVGGTGQDVALSATSSDESVVPARSIRFGGDGANRTVSLRVSPGAGARAATVEVTAEAASGTSTLTVSVRVGTSGPDTLRGTPGADLLLGGRGADTLTGRDGADTLCGGLGDDRLLGSDREDTLVGGDGRDDLGGGDDGDLLAGGDGNDVLRGQDGEDTLVAGNGDDDLRGGDGNDVLRGERGRDRLEGSYGDDHLDGGRHDDELRGGTGDDQLHGGPGEDGLDGGRGADVLYGDEGADHFRGGPGVDAAYDFSSEEGDTKDRTVENT